MKNLWIGLLALSTTLLITSCDKDDEEEMNGSSGQTAQLALSITGLEDLGDDHLYEGWIIVNGEAITTGTFSVNAMGEPSASGFEVNASDLASASTFVLTIEPSPDPDPAPSDIHILAGDFSDDDATLSVGHGAALGDDFSMAAGGYILATPTDGMMNNEKSGLWFLDPAAGPGAALELPTLPAGWNYEGWAVIDGTPVTTGTFTSVSTGDDSAPFSGSMSAPPFPGEDFLVNAPSGLSFPTDLAGGMAVISIEPVPDNSPAPFTLKPLVGAIASGALDHTYYTMDNAVTNTFPMGSAMR
jgi:hypothetical protein